LSISFDRVSDIYDATRGLPADVSEQVTNCILNRVAATPNTQFFEPGIGTGRIALPIIQRGYCYTGVDISEKMMDELRQKLQNAPHRLTLLKADAANLPFKNDSFDVALTVHLFHLMPAWKQALAEIRRVLKPNGVYLYSHSRANAASLDEFDFNQKRFDFEQQWRTILVNCGHPRVTYGAKEAEVLSALSQQGATLEIVVAACWRVELTVEELLDRYQNKMYSSCWQVPDHLFPRAIQELREWCQQYYGSLDTDLSHDVRFKLVVARNWATSA
jgi:SAM-dependent methyltransferase